MKKLIEYINESFLDYDTALVDVPEKKQDIEKLRILIKKFDKFGEEGEYEEGKDPYEQLLSDLEYSLKPKKFEDLKHSKETRYGEEYSVKLKKRTQYCDKIFSVYHNAYKKDVAFRDPTCVTFALVGIAYWIDNYSGLNPEDKDKYLKKLCTKYEKVFGINPEEATKITKLYDKKKVSIQDAIQAENETKASVQEIKDDFKNHKYTIFADSNDSAANIYIVDNKDYETLDEAFNNSVGKETPGAPIYNYNLDFILRLLVRDKKIYALYLCSGYYCIGEDKDKTIPGFGYYDEDILGKEIYRFSSYDNKYYYCGKIPDEANARYKGQGKCYKWHDSLWSVWKKDK